MDTQRIRQYVDDELAPEAREEFERALTEDEALRSRVAFERALRDRVERHLLQAAPAAPEGLAEKVRAGLEAADEAADEPRPAEAARGAFSRAGSIFRGPTRMNMLAVAACLAIVAGAVLFGIFGEPFVQQRLGVGDEAIAVLERAAEEASSEHVRCAPGTSALDEKMQYRTPDEIRENLSARLGREVPVFDLSSRGYRLVGGGECMLYPTRKSSVHIMYQHAERPKRISIFMQPNEGQFEAIVETNREYRAGELGLDDEGLDPSVWTDGRTVFILVACTPDDHASAMDVIRSIASLE